MKKSVVCEGAMTQHTVVSLDVVKFDGEVAIYAITGYNHFVDDEVAIEFLAGSKYSMASKFYADMIKYYVHSYNYGDQLTEVVVEEFIKCKQAEMGGKSV